MPERIGEKFFNWEPEQPLTDMDGERECRQQVPQRELQEASQRELHAGPERRYMLDGRLRQEKITLGKVPKRCWLFFTMKFETASEAELKADLEARFEEAAIVLPGDVGLPEGYQLLFLPGEHKMTVRAWNRTYPDPDFCGIERAADLSPGQEHRVELLLEDDCMVLYLDGVSAMSSRLYRRGQGNWGIQCYGLRMEISDVILRSCKAE